jgi:hypothetical protein
MKQKNIIRIKNLKTLRQGVFLTFYNGFFIIIKSARGQFYI